MSDGHEDSQTESTPEKKPAAHHGSTGRHTIDLGDGRKIHLLRNSAMQQNGVRFSAPEGQDPRPAPEDTDFLRQNGFTWRRREGYWSRQLITAEDKSAISAIEASQGIHQARIERSHRRTKNDLDCEEAFVKLANSIRERNGKAPIDYTFSSERQP